MRVRPPVSRWVLLAAVAAGAVLLHRLVLFTAVVRSGSMRPALEPGDVLVVMRMRRSTPVRRGDLIVFAAREPGGSLIKRVVGLPGERIEIDGRTVRVDGTPIVEPYASHGGAYRGAFAVPSGGYLVLGDDRETSTDSRSWDDPYVRRHELRGVVRARLGRTRVPSSGSARTVVTWRWYSPQGP